jgi:hypothetical protein
MKYFFGFLFTVFAVACSKDNRFACFTSSGKEITQTRQVNVFKNIRLSGKVTLTLLQGTEQSVEVFAGQNIIKNIKTRVENQELVIEDKNTCNFVRGYKREIKVTITTPYLYELTNESVSSIYMRDFRLDSLYIKAGGSGDNYISGNFKNLRISSHGNGDVYLSGATEAMAIYMNGQNYIHAFDFLVYGYLFLAHISQGNCHLNLTETDLFNYSIQSSGNVYYKGSAKTTEGSIESGAKGKLLETL